MAWAVPFLGAFAGAFLIVAWSRSFEVGYLIAAAVVVLVAGAALVAEWRRGGGRAASSLLAAALGTLLLAVGLGGVVEARLNRVATGWEELVAERLAQLDRELEARLRLTVARGRAAARQGAEQVATSSSENRFARLAAVRERTKVDAIVVFDRAGEPIVWAGDHYGPFPRRPRRARQGVSFVDRPLFSYLYFSYPIEGTDQHAVAAILLQTGLGPGQHGSPGVAERFAERADARPYFSPGPGGPDSWQFVVDGDTIAHAQFEPFVQAEWWAKVGNGGRRVVLPVVVVAYLLLVLAWYRGGARFRFASALPLLGVAALFSIAPLGPSFGAERLFSPVLFLLPVPPEITLGRLVFLLAPLAALAAAVRPVVLKGARGRRALWLGALAVALGFPAAMDLLLDGAAPGLLQGVVAYWGGFQLAALLILTMLAGLALPQNAAPRGGARGASGGRGRRRSRRNGPDRVGSGRGGRRRRTVRPLYLVAGLFLSLILAGAVLLRWRYAQRIEIWFLASWAVPFTLLALGIRSYAGQGSRLVRWLLAGCLAASAVLPYLWVAQVQARLRDAERGLSTLGLRPDPYLDYLLHQFAADLARREARGEDGVALVFRSWATSGLARESYPARIGIWGATGRQEAELVLGDPVAVRRGGPPGAQRLVQARERALATGAAVLEPALGASAGGRLLAVPLEEGRSVTVFVPPRRSFDRPAALVPILGPEPNPELRLTLIPNVTGIKDPGVIRWVATKEGWRSEAVLRYPDGEYHAHLDVHLPPLAVVMARGILILAFDLGILALLWVIGRAGTGNPPRPPGGWIALAGSFRSRVTVALFGFFLLPTVIFGTLAYRALAGEAARTARAVAERAAVQAVTIYPEVPGNWRAIAARIGEEVLYFHRGELAQASSPEAVELGVFGAWIPPSIYQNLRAGEAMSAVENRWLGQREYVVAYRRLPAGTLAVPVPVVGGETALRQRELADLLLFAVLLGGALSLALSLAVGRALARPIGQLRRAAAAVGAGRLSVRLPGRGAGEFGELFGSFNRMVRRLRHARAQEIRAARVLAWGEMSRQVAHEIKNPLTPIKLSVQHLRRAYADGRSDFGEILETNVDQILTEIDRLTEIARAFSRYGAPGDAAGPLEVVELEPVVNEALMLYRAGDAGIGFHVELEPGLPPVRARAGELKEVLLNLLENAYTALDGRGNVTIAARRVGGEVEVTVHDDGPGVPPELLSRIFEPHFSTHSTGTGLGLAIVRRIVEDWGGTVGVESRPGEGTTFAVRVLVAEGRGG